MIVGLYLLGSFTILNAQESNILNDTLVFYYKTDAYKLSSNQETEILNFLTNKKLLKIKVEGFADYVGSDTSNHVLAFKRAENISDFIINEQFIDSISVFSKSEQPKPKNYNEYQGNAMDRKVICYVMYSNNLLAENDVSLPDSSANYLDSINQLEVGERIVLRNILFYLGIAVIIPSSYSELLSLKEVLLKNPNLVVEIRGHVCCGVIPETSEDMPKPQQSDSNLKLSRNRAFAVKNYLIENGIDANRIRIKGMGFLEPLYYPEKNDKERQLNRRIELIVLKK
ncbi:hypothetical protein BAA08_10055 [Bizionia sp. APA-3]|nr:hypothetical protein BAA08_10055 [Bizionia sp. APA-3]